MAAIVNLVNSDSSGGRYTEVYYVDLNDTNTVTIQPTLIAAASGGPGQIDKIYELSITPTSALAATGIPGVTAFIVGGPSFKLNSNIPAAVNGGTYVIRVAGGI